MRNNLRKIVIGALLLIGIVGGSFTVVFADQDISAMLTNWFNQKTEESIGEIDEAIAVEQEKQTGRLKEELRLAIESAEQELEEFVKKEKLVRMEELERYADKLILELETAEIKLESEHGLEAELDQILSEAIEKMERVRERVNEESDVE